MKSKVATLREANDRCVAGDVQSQDPSAAYQVGPARPFPQGFPPVFRHKPLPVFDQATVASSVVSGNAVPLRMQSTAECVCFERESFGALHEMMSAMSEAERQDSWVEVYQPLQQFESAVGFEGPCEILIGAGTK